MNINIKISLQYLLNYNYNFNITKNKKKIYLKNFFLLLLLTEYLKIKKKLNIKFFILKKCKKYPNLIKAPNHYKNCQLRTFLKRYIYIININQNLTIKNFSYIYFFIIKYYYFFFFNFFESSLLILKKKRIRIELFNFSISQKNEMNKN